MWQCASMRPGKMNLPVASMTVSSGVSGRIEPSVSPTRVIRLPSTTRSLFGTGSPPDLDQINSPLALLAGLANELVARIAQDAGRIGRSAFKSRVRIGIENAAVIAEGPARDNHARTLEQPALDRLAHGHIGKPFATRHGDP